MREKILNIIYEGTKSQEFQELSVAGISAKLALPKSKITYTLQQLLKEGLLVKAEEKPILFLSRKALEEDFKTPIEQNVIKNLDLWMSSQTAEKKDFEKLIGHEGSLSSLVEQCKATIAYPPNGLPLMLTGETGTGKSFIARLAYEYALNHELIASNGRFVAVNCSEYANNPELLTANLFGYVKGAFTGADQDSPGLIELADGGVLFLDEVHSLKGECQEKLFHFMDQSVYHRMGDNKTWYSSKVRLIFATTENPKEVLLKTLQRRIPMQLKVPNLEQRGSYEKMQMILSMFALEEKRLNVRIQISSSVLSLLLSYPFTENIGGLKSTIQSSCVNALFQIDENKVMKIRLKNIPESVIRYSALETLLGNKEVKWYDLKDLEDEILALQDPYLFFEEIISKLENTRDFEEDFKEVQKMILNELSVNIASSQENSLNRLLSKIIKKKCSSYHIDLSGSKGEKIEKSFAQILNIPGKMEMILSSKKDVLDYISENLASNYFRYYSLAQDIAQEAQSALEIHLNPLQKIILIALLALADQNQKTPSRMGVILAHGDSSATSMAMCVNQWLERPVFDALDMPVFVSQEEICGQLNEYLKKMEGIEELFLLVDLGSLEQIYKNLNIQNVNIGIINSLNLKMALSIGQDMINEVPMEEVFERAKKYSRIDYHIERNREKPKMIICSCASGLGVAEKLRAVIQDSLPENSDLRLMVYDYNILEAQGVKAGIFDEYQVICVVGTLRPQHVSIPFVALEDLILQENTNRLDEYLQPFMNEREMSEFKKNVVKNFSLSNIMNALTILNPTKLLEQVANAIDLLQREINVSLCNNTCFGLYVHVSCLIERLVMNRGVEAYCKKEVFEKEQKVFIDAVKDSFADVERFYGVDIPVEEIGYMFDYVKNDQNYQKCA